MPQTNAERNLLQRCLEHRAGAWNDFVDRYLGLIYHVIHHTAHLRSATLRPEDIEDLASEILLRIVDGDYTVLRQFRGESGLSTYLTVVARRTCVNELTRRAEGQAEKLTPRATDGDVEEPPKAQLGLENLEEVQKLLRKLPAREREVVRLYYLEGRSYEEISTDLGIPVNSIGPVLSRARKKLRQDVKSPPAAYKGPPPRIHEE